jgi:cell shape-determining protein MreC
MESANKILSEIDYKVRKIVSDKNNLVLELKKSNDEIKELENQISELVKQNKELKEELELIKITNIINNSSDISESRIIINNLLKKIDKSISIISSKNK